MSSPNRTPFYSKLWRKRTRPPKLTTCKQLPLKQGPFNGKCHTEKFARTDETATSVALFSIEILLPAGVTMSIAFQLADALDANTKASLFCVGFR